MSVINVIFLGKSYSMPKDVLCYKECLDLFSDFRSQLIALADIDKSQRTFLPLENSFKIHLDIIAKQIIISLSNKGIYNITLDELSANSHSYALMQKIHSETELLIKRIEESASQDFENISQHIYCAKTSQIPETRISLWTNKISSALLYSFLETRRVTKQGHSALNEYIASVDYAREQIDNQKEVLINRVLSDVYFPKLYRALDLFIAECFNRYIALFDNAGLLSISNVASIDIARSSSLLKNADFVPDIHSLLSEAFVACPFNIEIYRFLIKNEIWDFQTFMTAKALKSDAKLCDDIRKYCDTHKDNILKIHIPIKILSSYTDKSSEDIIKSLYGGPKIKKYFWGDTEVTKEEAAIIEAKNKELLRTGTPDELLSIKMIRVIEV